MHTIRHADLRRRSLPAALLLAAAVLLAAGHGLGAEPARITVRADQPGMAVSPLLYGLFFEEINRAGDGGLYAELVRNRSFEDAAKPEAWTLIERGGVKGRMALDHTRPLNEQNPTGLRVEGIETGATGALGVANDGFQGMSVVKGARYDLALHARGSGCLTNRIRATLERADGKVLAEGRLEAADELWHRFSCTLAATASDPAARLVITMDINPIDPTNGIMPTLWLDMVSLFPQETYQGHGLRKDLVELMAAAKPAFLRFPGGSYVEGDTLANAFRWKDTVGEIAERPGHWNLWGYRSTDGLGFHEYLQLCEDLGAAPLFVINCGMSHKGFVLMDRMQEYVQDAVDALEYANGSIDTKWGALRARLGHPTPFNLKMMQIGNAQGGPLYNERYALFHDAIKAADPEVRLIANDGNGRPTSRPLDIVDEHHDGAPDYFLAQAARFDSQDRSGPKIYVGEYACAKECGDGNLKAALGEAAFMAGLERNGDHVIMSSYAPLFCHAGWKRRSPSAIVFNAAQAYGTPSYHIQTLFAANRGDFNLPVELVLPSLGPASRPALFAVAGRDGKSGETILKVVNASAEERATAVTFKGSAVGAARGWVLTSASPDDENSFEQAARVAPKPVTLPAATGALQHAFPAYSVTVLRFAPGAAPRAASP